MTHTYLHAQSSTRLFGGEPEAYLAIHDWFDATKEHCADFRHRFIRHHAEGVAECVARFGGVIDLGNGNTVETRLAAEQHLLEDCGGTLPQLSDWLACVVLPDWIAPMSAAEQASIAIRRWGGVEQDYLPLHAWMDAAVETHGLAGMALRHHAQGIFEAERLFGSVIRNADNRVVPVRYLCEQHVSNECGKRVPSLQDWVKTLVRKMWMSRGYHIH